MNEEVELWRDRPLEAVYPVVWLDGIVVKVHQDHQVLRKTIYLALAINMEGYKELLGIWIAEKEGAKFWAQVLTERDCIMKCVRLIQKAYKYSVKLCLYTENFTDSNLS